MLKPQSLFNLLLSAVPQFAAQPDQLSMTVRSGRIVSRLGNTLSFEYAYTLQLVVLDFTAHPDCLIVPIESWIRANQPDLLDNPDRREKGFRFEAEYKGTGVMDLILELDLTEAVRVVRMPPVDPTGITPDPLTTLERWQITHLDEPPPEGTYPMAEHWELYDQDQLIATWDSPADRV